MNNPPRMSVVSCPMCGCEGGHVRWRGRDRLMGVPGEFTVVQCKQCEFLYQNPRPADADIAAIYPPDYPAYNPAPAQGHKLLRSGGVKADATRHVLSTRLGYAQYADPPAGLQARLYAWIHAPKVKKLVFPMTGRGRMLDVGCSTGARMSEMKALGWNVSGIEFSEEVAAVAKRDHSDIYIGDILDAPFPEGAFDLVTCFHVLEHVTRPRDVLARMVRWLAPDGTLVIELPNAGGLGAKYFGTHWFLLDLPRHFHHFTPQTLTKMADLAGGRVVRIEHGDSIGTWLGSIRFREEERTGIQQKDRKSLKNWLKPLARAARYAGRGEMLRAFIQKR